MMMFQRPCYLDTGAHHGIEWTHQPWTDTTSVRVPNDAEPVWLKLMSRVGGRREWGQWEVPADSTPHLNEILTEAFGRTGIEPVTHVDVDIDLDTVGIESGESADGVGLRLGGYQLAWAGRHESFKRPYLYCDVLTGQLLVIGDGETRRIGWEPGTVLRVADIPEAVLTDRVSRSYTILARSTDDPHDGLRRTASALLGWRYHSDTPPAPADASLEVLPADRHAWRQVPTDYPHPRAGSLTVSPDGTAILVQRERGATVSTYTVPMTDERAALLAAFEHEFAYSADAYALLGADLQAAAILAEHNVSAQALARLAGHVRVVGPEDACVLISGPGHGSWQDLGWLQPGMPGILQPRHTLPELDRCFRATEAAALAGLGIPEGRAYSLRRDDATVRTVEQVADADRRHPTDAAHKGLKLLDHAAEPVPPQLHRAIETARTARETEVENWDSQDHYSGYSRSGLVAGLTEHRFTGPDGSVVSLWAVVDGWYEVGSDAGSGPRSTSRNRKAAPHGNSCATTTKHR
ncbi:hypothetical protein ACIGO9_31800 [Nocardia asteroides]|uniref:hypothetical protein n=1 Tax=Nocardia asteroides TaxID=1824 RepID=UPI0037CADC3C